ncbi:hypothetical protein [Pseudooceanicola onchidii]|uniref:hypothetical protein n=1 Tax=Pseudooceanicola onchidii TaxID=2562279 RepID=UPI0010AABCA4|nr:hypothetical protein [Pseudooceanicola onchidii]
MTLTSGDRETVHLFTANLDEDALWSFVTPDPDTGAYPLREALGVDSLDDTQVEGAVAEDLDGIGLAGFLTEGIGVDEGQIAADRARIDAIRGAVVIIKGAAFDGAHVPLSPKPPLAHFGSWSMTPVATTMEPLRSEAASGITTPAPQPAPVNAPKTSRLTLWLLLGMAALILIVMGLFA